MHNTSFVAKALGKAAAIKARAAKRPKSKKAELQFVRQPGLLSQPRAKYRKQVKRSKSPSKPYSDGEADVHGWEKAKKAQTEMEKMYAAEAEQERQRDNDLRDLQLPGQPQERPTKEGRKKMSAELKKILDKPADDDDEEVNIEEVVEVLSWMQQYDGAHS